MPMILWGNISQFSVFMVLQLLASYRKTGLLELEDKEEKATIYLRDGLVEAVSIPRSDHMLGARLVKAGCLTQAQLRKIILSARLRDEDEFLGFTLMKSGVVKQEDLARTLRKQAFANTLELSNWVEGSFRFVVPRVQAHFEVSPHINVQHLLLETSRRLDEGQRPHKQKTVLPEETLCAECPSHCSEAQKDKYLKDGICLWRNMPVIAREAVFSPNPHPLYETEGEEYNFDLPFL